MYFSVFYVVGMGLTVPWPLRLLYVHVIFPTSLNDLFGKGTPYEKIVFPFTLGINPQKGRVAILNHSDSFFAVICDRYKCEMGLLLPGEARCEVAMMRSRVTYILFCSVYSQNRILHAARRSREVPKVILYHVFICHDVNGMAVLLTAVNRHIPGFGLVCRCDIYFAHFCCRIC